MHRPVVVVTVVELAVVVDVVSTQVSHSTGQFRRVTAPNNASLQNESSVPHACGSGVPLQASVVVVVVVFVVVDVTVVVLLVVVVTHEPQSTGQLCLRMPPNSGWSQAAPSLPQSSGSWMPLQAAVVVVVVVDVAVVDGTVVDVTLVVLLTVVVVDTVVVDTVVVVGSDGVVELLVVEVAVVAVVVVFVVRVHVVVEVAVAVVAVDVSGHAVCSPVASRVP